MEVSIKSCVISSETVAGVNGDELQQEVYGLSQINISGEQTLRIW